MKAVARLVLGLVIFDAAVAAPTLEPINYDSESYDATLEDLDNLYNYENIPMGQAEVLLKALHEELLGIVFFKIFLLIYKLRCSVLIISYEPFLQNVQSVRDEH